LHRLHASLEDNDVVWAARFDGSSGEVALGLGWGIDGVMRWPQRRVVDLQRGQRWGHEDHGVAWTKPVRPAWMDAATSAALPAAVAMRELRGQVTPRGCRTRVVLGATPWRDAKACTKEDLAGLSRARWQAELEVRSLKQTMPRDVRRWKSPEMGRKDIWGHLLVSNLIRAAMAQAALRQGLWPRQGRRQGARQTLAAVHSPLGEASPSRRQGVIQMVLSAIARHRVGQRPDRYEPRVRKLRPKPYPLMTVPLPQAGARLAQAA